MIYENYYDEEPDLESEQKKEWHDNQRSPLFYFVLTLLVALGLLVAGILYVPKWVAQSHPELYDVLGGNDTENYGVRGANKQTIENNPNQNTSGNQASTGVRSTKQ